MTVNVISDVLNTFSFVGLIIAHVIYPNDDTFLESDEKLDNEFCKLQDKEAALRKKIHEDELTYEQYLFVQAELDKTNQRMTMVLREQQYGNYYDTD